jgi:FKBP-type peptidyl-prolyl cis-trans isomerase FklB
LKNPGIRTVLAGFCLALLLTGCDQTAVAESDSTPEQGKKIVLDSELKQASYLLGYLRTQDLSSQTNGTLDLEAYLQGTSDSVGQVESVVNPADQSRLMAALQQAVEAKKAEASQGVREDGDKFREEYAKGDGVTTLASGMLYEVMTEGSGAKPTAADTVTTHYHGTLIDGTVFDSSVERGQPASFPVGGVISGWTEALQLMAVGSKWRLVIPPDLAYGERGAGGDIGPGATLIFEVELLDIN